MGPLPYSGLREVLQVDLLQRGPQAEAAEVEALHQPSVGEEEVEEGAA